MATVRKVGVCLLLAVGMVGAAGAQNPDPQQGKSLGEIARELRAQKQAAAAARAAAAAQPALPVTPAAAPTPAMQPAATAPAAIPAPAAPAAAAAVPITQASLGAKPVLAATAAAKSVPAPATKSTPAAATKPAPAKPEASLANPPAGDPAEIERFNESVRRLVLRQDYAGLDKLADSLRAEKSRFTGGEWKLHLLYKGLEKMTMGGEASDADWQAHLKFFDQWMAANPQSITARVGLAEAYVGYAWEARGTGSASTVTEQGWQLFGERNEKAGDTLMEAAKLAAKCPEWYTAMQRVALAAGANKQRMEAVLAKAIAFEPAYQYYYMEHTTALLPRWVGEEGDIAAFAEQTYRRAGGKQGAYLYFEIATSLCGECGEFETQMFSWQKIQEGFAAHEELYGFTPKQLKQFAMMAASYE